MTQSLLLKQSRNMIKRIINESPQTIIVYGIKYVDDGFGGSVADPFNYDTPKTIVCRISHEKKTVEKNEVSAVGLSTNLTRYILVDHNTTIRENESFEALGKKWRIGAVDALNKFGGITGYQAPLTESAVLQEEIE